MCGAADDPSSPTRHDDHPDKQIVELALATQLIHERRVKYGTTCVLDRMPWPCAARQLADAVMRTPTLAIARRRYMGR